MKTYPIMLRKVCRNPHNNQKYITVPKEFPIDEGMIVKLVPMRVRRMK